MTHGERTLSNMAEEPEQRAREIARQVVASRNMQRDNGQVYGAALEAALTAIRTAEDREKVLLQRAIDLIEGDLVGAEWKAACHLFCKDARQALGGTNA